MRIRRLWDRLNPETINIARKISELNGKVLLIGGLIADNVRLSPKLISNTGLQYV